MLRFLLIILISTVSVCQIVKTEKGSIEFLGLKNWHITNLIDTLKSLDPDGSLHACQAILIKDLQFIEAAVLSFHYNDTIFTTVSLIEAEDSMRVKYRKISYEQMERPPDWDEVLPIVKEFNIVHMGIQFYGFILLEQYDKAINLKDFITSNEAIKIEKFWRFLLNHKTNVDREKAINILIHDINKSNRLIAVSLLSNFYNSDEIWHNLVDALRDTDQDIRLIAQATLAMFLANFNKEVNWSPVKESIRYLLNGTNLQSFYVVLDLLIKTKISPTLGKALLRGNSELLIAFLKSENIKIREKVFSFLAYLSHKNFNNYKDWENWLNSQ